MHFIPVIYFSALSYYLWRRHRSFDIAFYMTALFTFTSACAAIMVEHGIMQGNGGVLFDGWEPDLDFIPTVLYCTLVTITILPFTTVHTDKLETITNNHKYLLLAFAVFIVLQGLLMYYIVGSTISDILNGDFKELKNAGYAGEATPADVKMLSMSLPFRIMFYLSYMTTFGLPLFFYYSCIERRPLWLTFPLLAASVSPILRGIMSADRTEIIYYGLMFIFCLVFFRKKMTKAFKWFLAMVTIPVALVGVFYIISVSVARFDENDEGASGSMLEYAGQSYVNFCFFYKHHDENLFYFERELPITLLVVNKSQYTDTKEERTAKEGFFIGVFASHVGSWLLDTGVVGASVISCLFALLCVAVIRYYGRRVFDVSEFLMLFILASVPLFGVFYYRFYNPNIALQYLIAGFLFLFSKIKIVWSSLGDKGENNGTTDMVGPMDSPNKEHTYTLSQP
ncbi:MAG: oligosaccharide repeat unit polymerase [Bacteroidaceae bacterium]|nr:oligosaccharide repeat unit polymerase [Bacteroidaceae bacterium]